MGLLTQHIYRSSNGDRWLLVTDTVSGRKFVRHEANQSSGGHLTDTDVDDFLEIGGSGPEFAARRLAACGLRGVPGAGGAAARFAHLASAVASPAFPIAGIRHETRGI